jgi:N-acetylneuraminate synthase
MTQGEKNNRISLSKSLVYGGNLRKGTIIGIEHLKAKSPSRGISPLNYQSYIGKRLLTSVKTDQYLRDEHFNGEILSEIKTKHLKNWGVVGRLNDFNNFLDIEPKFIEMHLTWRDLLSFKRLTGNYSQMLTIHAPEYFKDKLVDLTTDDIEISNNSIEAIQQTILLTKKISGKFKQYNKGKPFVVVHPGGHFEHLPPVNKDSLYRNLRENLKKIDTTGVELLIENMPPLPWYFGGQWYNSVFMDAAEIESFVASTGWKICYDISHAALYCNHAKVDLIDHAKTLLPYTRYLHISDAKGSAEEGLQIGEGSVDFKSLAKIFKGKKIPFVPEIWQGHLNSGRGFKEALSKLDYLGWE